MNKDERVTGLELAKRARTALEGKKAEDVVLLDVRGISSVMDFCLMVSGSSAPHLKAMFNEVLAALKKTIGVHPYRRTGTPESGWLLLDYIDVVIHIFSPEQREYYGMEELWPKARRLK